MNRNNLLQSIASMIGWRPHGTVTTDGPPAKYQHHWLFTTEVTTILIELEKKAKTQRIILYK